MTKVDRKLGTDFLRGPLEQLDTQGKELATTEISDFLWKKRQQASLHLEPKKLALRIANE